MIEPQPRSVKAMHHRATAWEASVTARGQTIRLAFTQRRTKTALLGIAQDNSHLILSLLGDWDGTAHYSADMGWTFGPARVHFTGRTERELT